MKTSKLLLGVGLVLLAVSNAQADPNKQFDKGIEKSIEKFNGFPPVVPKLKPMPQPNPCGAGQCPSVGIDIQDKTELLTINTPVNVDEVVTSHVR